MSKVRRVNRVGWRATTLGVGGLAATAALAVGAAAPVKGARYSGSTEQASPQTVSFKVSSNGKKVTQLKVPIELGCQGGGIKSPNPGTAKITAQHTFKATLYMLNPQGVVTQQKEIVTGTFARHHKETGTITSVFTGGTCGKTVKYSTKAS